MFYLMYCGVKIATKDQVAVRINVAIEGLNNLMTARAFVLKCHFFQYYNCPTARLQESLEKDW